MRSGPRYSIFCISPRRVWHKSITVPVYSVGSSMVTVRYGSSMAFSWVGVGMSAEVGHEDVGGRTHADLLGVVADLGLHKPQLGARREHAVDDPHGADDAAVLVEVGVEQQRLQGLIGVARRRGDAGDDGVEQFGH